MGIAAVATEYHYTLTGPQSRVFESPSRFRVLVAGRRFGKALALDTPIPTPSGWSTMGALAEGDALFDENGRPCRVTLATEIMEGRPCYRVVFSDGVEIVADADHQWMTWDRKQRKNVARNRRWEERNGRQGRTWHAGPQNASPVIRTTREIAESLTASARGDTNHSVECCGPLQLPPADLPLDPYVLGAWLGDGASKSAKIYSDDPEILQHFVDAGVPVRRGPNDYEYLLQNGDRSRNVRVGGLQAKLRGMGVLGNKHIPSVYLRASSDQRLALLQGLLDTDGTTSTTGAVEFCSTNTALAEGVLDLARSLGIRAVMSVGRAKLYGRDCGPKYRVTWTSPVEVFRLGRKLDRLRTRARSDRNVSHRFITGVTPCDSVPVRCIQVDSPSSLYLASEGYIPTHNTYLSAFELLRSALNRRTISWYVAPTYRMAKEIAWDAVKRIVPREYLARRPNETELSIELVNGSRIALKGADNPDSLRGLGLNFVVLDEFAQLDKRLWEEVLRPALSDRVGSALFTGTPQGFNYAYDLYLDGVKRKGGEWESWSFTTLQGGNVLAAEVEAARSSLDHRVFRREYEASFEVLSGRVYDNFDRLLNVDTNVRDTGGEILIGQDFNVNPMATVIGVKAGDELHILDSLEIQTSNTEEIAAEIKRRYPTRRVIVCPDPSGRARKTSAVAGVTDFTILERQGFQIDAPKAAPAIVDRVNAVQTMLKDATGRRRLKIHPRATSLIKALDGLTYKDGTSIPDKNSGLDHLADSIGYLVWQRFNLLVNPPTVRPFSISF